MPRQLRSHEINFVDPIEWAKSLGIEPQPVPGYVIQIDFICREDAERVYEAIKKLLAEMDQIGTLSLRNCDNE